MRKLDEDTKEAMFQALEIGFEAGFNHARQNPDADIATTKAMLLPMIRAGFEAMAKRAGQ